MEANLDFWYFLMQTALELVGIGIGVWVAVRFYLADQQARFGQLRVDVSSIKGEIASLQHILTLVVERAMIYFTSDIDRETTKMIEERRQAELDRLMEETKNELKNVFHQEIAKLGLQSAVMETPTLDKQLNNIVAKSLESATQETEETAKLLGVSPVVRKVLLAAARVSPATLSQIASALSADYPTEVIAFSLEQLEEMDLVRRECTHVPGRDTLIYRLTDRGVEVGGSLVKGSSESKISPY